MQTLTTKQIAALISAAPRTTGRSDFAIDSIRAAAFREVRYLSQFTTDLMMAYYRVACAAQMIQRLTQTHRVTGAPLLRFRELRPYQVAALVQALAAEMVTRTVLIDDATASALVAELIRQVA